MTDPSRTAPLVTIVVPVYNGEQYLRESLDSILAQSYPHCEVLVMDDASTDQTPAIIASYGPRVTAIHQSTNRGQFANVNDGIMRARGDYIAVYHADDVYHSAIVEREAAFLRQNPEVGAVFCLDAFIDAKGREYGRLAIPPEVQSDGPLPYAVILNALLTHKNRFLVTPSAMVCAAVYHDVGLYRGEEFGIASDLEMWVRIARRYSLGILQEHLMWYRHGHGNLSQRHYHLRTVPEAHFRILDAQLTSDSHLATTDALAAHDGHRAEDLIMLAINHYILGHLPESVALLRQVDPRRLLGSSRVQRGRLLVLLYGLKVLVRLPRVQFIADLCYRRWHVRELS